MDNKNRFYDLFDKLSLGAISLFALECVLGSSGRWLTFGSLSIRILLFLICFILTLPAIFRNLRNLIRNPHVILAVLFGVCLAVGAVLGWQRGNKLSFIKNDISSFLTLALLPGFLATISSPKRASGITNIIYWGSVVLASITVVLHFVFSLPTDWQINAINIWLNRHSMGGLSTMATGMQRIYMKSQIFLQIGIVLGIGKIWSKKGYVRWLLFLAEGILVFGSLLTYTRGFWLGLAFSALTLLILCPQKWKNYLSTVGITLALVIGLFLLSALAYGKPVATYELINRFDPDLISGAVFLPGTTDPNYTNPSSPTELPTDPTDPTDPNADLDAVMIRRKTLELLGQQINKHPLFGSGLGTNLDEIRTDGKVEYMYLDIFMKIGLVGFILFFAVFFLPLYPLLKHRLQWFAQHKTVAWDSIQMQNTGFIAAYIGVAITSYLNPFMINPMGILLVMLLTATGQQEDKLTTSMQGETL